MSRIHLIARLALVILGLFVLNESLRSPFLFLKVSSREVAPAWSRIAGLTIFSIVCFGLVFELLFNADMWAAKMTGPPNGSDIEASHLWVVAGFRVVLCFCGLLILGANITFIVKAIAFVLTGPRLITEMVVHQYVDGKFVMGLGRWMELVASVAKVVLGAYLVYGAPQYVRWQLGEADVASSGGRCADSPLKNESGDN